MAASEFFTIVQYGKETTKGTAVAAARIRAGVAPRITTDSKVELIPEQLNVRMKFRRAHVYERLYQNTLSTPHAGFQQLVLPFLTGVKGNVTPTEQTPSQGDYLWTFTPNLTAAAGSNTPDSFTLQLGDDEQAWRAPYCMTPRISLKGSVSQDGGAAPVSLEQEIFGRFIEENAFTGALSLENSTPINSKLAQLWVNSAWASVGTTEVSDALVDFGLEIITGVHPVFRGATTNYFNAHREGEMDLTLALTIDSVLRDELLSSQQAGELQVLRLKLNGPQIGTGVNHSLIVDASGVWEDVTPRDSSDRGDNLAVLAFHCHYDMTGAKGFTILLSTNQATF